MARLNSNISSMGMRRGVGVQAYAEKALVGLGGAAELVDESCWVLMG